MTPILGLHAYHGGAATALVIDGELVAAHGAGFPALASACCLQDAGLRPIVPPEQAVETFGKTRMDVLVLGNYFASRTRAGSGE